MSRKNAFGIFWGFLAVMLVFTILSRAAAGAAMARVETVKISTGTIEHRVSGNGRVEAGKETVVYTESGQRVEEVCVREGQTVESGDVLFRISLSELDEQITAARQNMEKARLQIQDIRNRRNQEQQDQATARNRAAEDYDRAVLQGEQSAAEAKSAWDAAEQALRDFTGSSDVGMFGDRKEEAAGCPEEESQNAAERICGSADGSDRLELGDGSTDGSSRLESDIGSMDGSSRLESGSGSMDGSDRLELGDGSTDGSSCLQLGDGSTDGSSRSESDIDSTDENSRSGAGDGGAGSQEAGAEWEMRRSELEQAAAAAKQAYEEAVSAKDSSIRAAGRALEDASKEADSDSTLEQNEITRQQEEFALNKLLALRAAEGQIRAPVRGIVTEILVAAGEFTSDGTAVRMAEASGKGSLIVSVDRADGEFISKGCRAEIKAFGNAEKICDYTVSEIAENKEDSTLLDVRIDLPEGVLEAGASAEVTLLSNSENFAATLPVEALHEESGGYYVLVLEEVQGVLGAELTVRRLDVAVPDKNGALAAVEEGVLSGEQEVVCSSSRMLREGDRVRRKET